MEILTLLAALAAQPADAQPQPVVAVPLPRMSIYGAGGGGSGGTIYLQAHAGDLDGDGVPDDAVLKLACAGGELRTAHYILSPRDAATGQSTGKRTHHPVTFVKEWSAATPLLAQMRPGYDVKSNTKGRVAGYNVKENKGARMTADGGGWTAIALSDTEGMCAAADSAIKATKSRSNIQNN